MSGSLSLQILVALIAVASVVLADPTFVSYSGVFGGDLPRIPGRFYIRNAYTRVPVIAKDRPASIPVAARPVPLAPAVVPSAVSAVVPGIATRTRLG
jgi:hypothetical protein